MEKNREYYESLDKRTKEYKEWKKEKEQKEAFVNAALDQEETFEGLGDAIEAFTEATGIKKAVKWIFGDDCGCEERKNALNRLFPYAKKLTQEEYEYLDDYFQKKANKVTVEVQSEMVAIFNRVFGQNARLTSCSPCFKNNIQDRLHKIYKAYKVE